MRDYLLLAFVIGLVPVIIFRPWIGAIAWTWIGLMNPHLYAWGLRDFPFAQVIGIAFLLAWLIARDKKMFPLTPGIVGMCVLLLFVTLKNPVAWNQEVAWSTWGQYVKVVGATLLIATLIHSPGRVRWFLWTVMFSIGVFYGVRGGLFVLATGGEYNVQGPTPSFIGGNTHLGVALLMVAPMFVAFLRDTVKPWLKAGSFAALALNLLATVFTYSRGAWLGLAAVGGLLFLRTKRKLLILALLIPVGIVGIGLIPEKVFTRADTIATYEEDLSAMQRLQGWGVAINVAMRHPLGSGFTLDATPVEKWMEYANFRRPEFNRANAAHSIYFQMLGDHGFVGLALFLFTLFGTFWTLQRVRLLARGSAEKLWLGEYATALMIGLAGYSVAGAFVSLAYFDLFYTFVILSGILLREVRVVAVEQHAEEMKSQVTPPATSAAT